MAENKTKPTRGSVTTFLAKIKNQESRKDTLSILKLMETVSKSKPVMWGSSIIGFGTIHYVYESGREGDMPVIAFSPRKQNITFYLGLENVKDELSGLGTYKSGKGCLYVKSLKDIDATVLKRVLAKAFKERLRKHAQLA